MSGDVTRALLTALFIVDAAKPSISRRAVCQKQGLMSAAATQDRNWVLQRHGTKHGMEKDLRGEATVEGPPVCFVCRHQSAVYN